MSLSSVGTHLTLKSCTPLLMPHFCASSLSAQMLVCSNNLDLLGFATQFIKQWLIFVNRIKPYFSDIISPSQAVFCLIEELLTMLSLFKNILPTLERSKAKISTWSWNWPEKSLWQARVFFHQRHPSCFQFFHYPHQVYSLLCQLIFHLHTG